MSKRTCSPGEHPHADRQNYTAEDYMRMCRDDEAEWSLSEYARLAGVSRAFLYRAMILASVPEDEFEAALEYTLARGLRSTTALADEIKRRTGRARRHIDKCPHCGGPLRERER